MKPQVWQTILTALDTWKTYVATLVIAWSGAYLLTPVAGWLAFRVGAVDLPGPRKVHAKPMPRLGGVAVFIGFCLPWGGYYLMENRVTETFHNYERLVGALFLGSLAMLALGIYDDVKRLDAIKKLAVQVLVCCGLYLGGYRITGINIPLGGHWELGWLSLPVSVVWMVGVTNAINLLDGIDGLVPGVTVCIALSLGVINMLGGNIIVALLTMCLAGAALGFLPHNYSPARIFLGDSGSLSIGLILSCIGILSLFKAATAMLVGVPLLLFALPLYDTTFVLVRRVIRGDPIFKADRTHVHHRLLARGFSQKQAAKLLYFVSAALGLAGVLLSFEEALEVLAIPACLIVLMAVVMWRRSYRPAAAHSPATEADAAQRAAGQRSSQ